MPDVRKILADPKFQGMDLEERRKVLSTVDPDRFGVMDTQEQDRFLNFKLTPVKPPEPERIPGMEKLGALPGVPAPNPQMGFTNWRQGLPDIVRLPLGAAAAVGKGGLNMVGGLLDAGEAVTGFEPLGAVSHFVKDAQVSSEDGRSGDYFTPEEQSYDSLGGLLNLAGSGVGSSLISMIPGMGTGKLLSQIDKIKALGPGAQLAAKYLGGVAAGSALETTADSGSAYRQVMDESGNRPLAQDVGLETFKREMPATVATNLLEYLLPTVGKAIPRAALGATFEGGQELVQGEMQRGAREKFGLLNGDVGRARLEDFIGGAAGGLATGALMAGEGRSTRQQPQPAAEAPKVKAEPKPAAPPTYTPEQYQAAVDLASKDTKGIAVNIRQSLGVGFKEANAMLGQMQSEGLLERKKTKTGGSWKFIGLQPEAAAEAPAVTPSPSPSVKDARQESSALPSDQVSGDDGSSANPDKTTNSRLPRPSVVEPRSDSQNNQTGKSNIQAAGIREAYGPESDPSRSEAAQFQDSPRGIDVPSPQPTSKVVNPPKGLDLQMQQDIDGLTWRNVGSFTGKDSFSAEAFPKNNSDEWVYRWRYVDKWGDKFEETNTVNDLKTARATLEEFYEEFLPAEETPQPKTPAVESDSTDKLITAFSRAMDAGESFGNITEFMGRVEKETGLSSARNEIQPKEAYDVLEAAVNRKLAVDGRRDMKPGADFKNTIGRLRAFMGKLPTQTSRSETQIKFQQFSTPPTLSYFAARLAAPTSQDTVLEPSAGTGSLAAWAAASGAKVVANEIDPKRADLLVKLGYDKVTRENAEQIHNVLPSDVKPSVVLMNPPFSASGVRGGKNTNETGYKHVEQAFNRLEPGGRLVVILGEGATLEAATAKPFWQSIAKKGSIRANIGVDGKEYAKYGTTFGNRVVVIDKTGATPGKTWTEQYAGIVKGDFGNIEDAWDAVKQIAEDRGQSNSVVDEGAPDQGAGRPRPDTIQPGGNATAGAKSTSDRPTANTGGRAGARSASNTRPGKTGKSGSRTEEVPASVPTSEPVDAKPAGELPTPADVAVQPVRSLEPTEAEIDSKFGEIIDAAAKAARDRLRDKMRGNKLNSGIDPQDLLDLATIAVQKMRQHGISFKKWSGPYVEEMGDWVREHLQAIRDRAEELYDEWREAAIRQIKAVTTPKADTKPEEPPAPKPAPKKLEPVAKEEPRKAAKGEDDGENVFYVPAKLPASWGALPHKGLIVETQAMAATEEPDLTLKPDLPDELIRTGELTEVQINAVTLAAMAHQNMLDEETRQGFFIGDGTGVGKGREIAATMLHHWNQGVKRQVWVSYKEDLIKDAKRDLNDLGANIPIISIKKFKKGQPIAAKFKEGIVFIPYTTLAGTDVPTILTQDNVQKKDQNNAKFYRVDQLAEWLGEESVIVLDEAHEAKNAVPGAAGRGKGQQSNAGRAVVAIQDRLKKARVLYASGTGFSDVSNLGYVARLGLWGKGTAFADFNAFQNAVARGGIGAMEMVARDLKAQGKYVSRFLSYKGVDFEEVTHALTKDQIQILDSAGQAWRTIRDKMNEALQVTESAASEAKKAANSVYWGANQRFYRTVYTAMKVPTLFASVDAALNKDHSVVISVMSTGEAAMKRGIEDMLSSNGTLDELDISPAKALIDLVRQHFPVRQYEEYTDENGNLQARPVSDSNGNPVFNQDAIAMREALIKDLEQLRMPESALDQILNRYGADNVAEMTGRKQRLVENEQGERSLENRKGDGEDSVNIEEARQFQEGKKRIAIISSAASTGISLHADNRAKNRQRRTHIILELKWSADKQMQDFGRTHRTNEASQPVYQLLSLNIGPEKRFSSSIARRLEQMGALSRGDRGSSGAGDIAKYNFETPYGQAAVTAIIEDMKKNNVEMLRKMGLEDNADEDHWVNKIKRKSGQSTEISVTQFLNRLMSLPFSEQNELFDDFMQKFAEAIEVAKREGTFDQGAEKIQADKINFAAEPIVVRSDSATGARTIHYQLEAINKRLRLPWAKTSNFWSKGGRFFRQSESGQIILVDAEKFNTTTRADGSLEDEFLAITAGGTRRKVTSEILKEKFNQVPADNETKALWDEQFEKAGPTVSETIHLIGGSVLPVYDKISSVQGNLRVQVAMLADKSRVIGLRIQSSKIKSVLRSLGFGTVLTPADVHEAVLAGEKYTLASGLQIKKIKRAGEDRIEVVIPAHVAETAGAIVKQNGGFTETIQFSERFFIASDEKGVEALRGILSIYPVMEDSQGEVRMAEGKQDSAGMVSERMDPESGVLRIDPAVAKVVRELADRIKKALRSPAPDPGTPVAKKTIRKLRQRQIKMDVADREYRAILRKVSGGIETKKLTQKQAEEALDLMATATTPLTAVINSPSFVLGRSMAGAKVYEAAEEAWFEQERLNERFAKNWSRINKGTTKKQRNKIALYRFVSQIVEMRDEESAREWLESIGEDASIVDNLDDFLTEQEKKVNADWTTFFFEPTRKMGIAKGLLKSEQQFTNYLSFYHESMLRFNKSKLKDAAADLAIELGLPVHLTEQILEKASPKNVKFGSFDYERQAWSIPGLRDADLIAEVYRKGFARKVAVTQFLKTANPLTKKIADPAVRTYSRLYIKQYAGVPQGSVFFDSALNAIPAIRKLGLSGGQLAGWATAIQYNAKIGFNLFTPMLNLTQTVLNTFPAVGTVTAFRVMPKSLAYTLLPGKLNPFRRSLVELKVGGIYSDDAGQSKFDRPVFHGAAESVQQAAGFLFNKAESFNRATAYLAGLELARREGLSGEAAVKRARGVVRVTQFYSGRLDAPLFSRSPHGKILMQFKTFTVKQIEFVKMLPRKQQLEFLAWTVAMGGPASLGILQAFKAAWPDWELTELLEKWHEEANIAAWIGAGRLRYQMGLFTLPGLEYLGSGQATAKISQWVTGPTFGTLTDIGDKGIKAIKDPEKFDKFAESIIRGVTPGGAEIMRARKAYEEAEDAGEALRILTGTEPKK